MRDGLIISALSVLPRHRASHAMGWIARRVGGLAARLFAWWFQLDLDEAEHPLARYRSVDELFTRRAKPGVRPIADVPGGLVVPCDGRLIAVFPDGAPVVLDGVTLDLESWWEGADGPLDVAIVYLSPRDLHTVHAPADLEVTGWRYAPGERWPVAPWARLREGHPIDANERLVMRATWGERRLWLSMVAAFGVGRIETPFAGFPSVGTQAACAHAASAGDEVGVFHLGSTVVLAVPAGTVDWQVTAGAAVKRGQVLATAR